MESPPKILTGLELRCHVQPYDWQPLGTTIQVSRIN